MDIGRPLKRIEVHPIENPVPQVEPAPEPQKELPPVEEPDKEPVGV